MEEKKAMLELIHQSTTYKMIIPQEVEKKIRLLCREIHNVEWSGVLFYKKEGSFNDGSLTITCVDIYQMDEGSQGYTEYDMSPDVINYMTEHPELLDGSTYTGLIHSHQQFSTFFSGTDTNTLKEEGNDMNHFVSLIVNNAGKYTAGITRKVYKEQHITENIKYPTWGDNIITINGRVYDKEVAQLEWYNLNIEIEGVDNTFENEMLARIKEIRASKAKKVPATPMYNGSYAPKTGGYVPVGNYGRPKEEFSQRVNAGPANTIKRDTKQPTLFDNEEYIIDYNTLKIDEKLVDWVVKQTITCSAIVSESTNIDLEKWAKSLDTIYSKRFNTIKEFENFAANFVDYLVNFTEDPEAAAFMDETEMVAILAYQVNEKLSKLPKSKWLDKWISLYDDYIL